MSELLEPSPATTTSVKSEMSEESEAAIPRPPDSSAVGGPTRPEGGTRSEATDSDPGPAKTGGRNTGRVKALRVDVKIKPERRPSADLDEERVAFLADAEAEAGGGTAEATKESDREPSTPSEAGLEVHPSPDEMGDPPPDSLFQPWPEVPSKTFKCVALLPGHAFTPPCGPGFKFYTRPVLRPKYAVASALGPAWPGPTHVAFGDTVEAQLQPEAWGTHWLKRNWLRVQVTDPGLVHAAAAGGNQGGGKPTQQATPQSGSLYFWVRLDGQLADRSRPAEASVSFFEEVFEGDEKLQARLLPPVDDSYFDEDDAAVRYFTVESNLLRYPDPPLDQDRGQRLLPSPKFATDSHAALRGPLVRQGGVVCVSAEAPKRVLVGGRLLSFRVSFYRVADPRFPDGEWWVHDLWPDKPGAPGISLASAHQQAPALWRGVSAPEEKGEKGAHQVGPLRSLLAEHGLEEYTASLEALGVTEPHHLVKLTLAQVGQVVESLDGGEEGVRPVHERKLFALTRGRNLHGATFTVDVSDQGGSKAALRRKASGGSYLGSDARPVLSRSNSSNSSRSNATRGGLSRANSLGPVKPGLRNPRAKSGDQTEPPCGQPGAAAAKDPAAGAPLDSTPGLHPSLLAALHARFGEGSGIAEVVEVVRAALEEQGVTSGQDLRHVDLVLLCEQAKAGGAKPVHVAKLKEWAQTAREQSEGIRAEGAVLSVQPPPTTSTQALLGPPPEVRPQTEQPTKPKAKPPPPKRGMSFGFSRRASHDAASKEETKEEPKEEPKEESQADPMHEAVVGRFGDFYGEIVQSFLMTQGVLCEADLVGRDEQRLCIAGEAVGLKPVQLSKLKAWVLEVNNLFGSDESSWRPQRVRPAMPHERGNSKLKLKK